MFSNVIRPFHTTNWLAAGLVFCLFVPVAGVSAPAERFVSPTGDDSAAGSRTKPWKTIQHTIDSLLPGDTAVALPGIYFEKPEFNRSGNPVVGPITLRAEKGAIIDGAKSVGDHLISIYHQSYIHIVGFELRNNLEVKDDGSGIRIEGECSNIELRDNVIHDVRGKNAMGITVYGTSAEFAINDITIDGNEIYDCEPAPSEALVLNGNVDGFEVTNNAVRDVNNIGIDFIGGEKSICKDRTKVARNGICAKNTVLRARSNYGGGYGAGIYADGAKNVLIDGNTVAECDLGIEIGAENKDLVATGIVVRGNILRDNDKAGIAVGGFSTKKSGRVEGCTFTGNTLKDNTGAGKKAQGEIWVQVASGNTFEGNTVEGDGGRPLLLAEKMAGDNVFKNNVWHSDKGAAKTAFVWRGKWCEGFAGYVKISGQGEGSRFEKQLTSTKLLEPGR